MDVARSSETLVSYRITTWPRSTEDRDTNVHLRENIILQPRTGSQSHG